MEALAGRLRRNGVLRIATDWQPYAIGYSEAHCEPCPMLRNLSPDGTFVPRPAERSPTRFELRGERLGHEVWDLAFSRP